MYYLRLAWGNLNITLLECEMSAIVQECEHLWHCLSLGLERKLTFPSPLATAQSSKFVGILSATLKKHYLLPFETAQLEFHRLH